TRQPARPGARRERSRVHTAQNRQNGNGLCHHSRDASKNGKTLHPSSPQRGEVGRELHPPARPPSSERRYTMKPVTSALRHAAVALGLALGLALLLALLLALTIPAALAHQAISGRLTPAHEGGPGTSAPFARAPALQSREHHGVSISGAVFNSTHG